MTRRIIPVVLLLASFLLSAGLHAAEFRSAWPEHLERVWAGPEYWANPLQDWRISRGRLECVVSGGNRHVQLLTHPLGSEQGGFAMRVRLGRLDSNQPLGEGWTGFRVGIRGEIDGYRSAAIWGHGLNVGVTTSGILFVGSRHLEDLERSRAAQASVPLDDIELHLQGEPGANGYTFRLSAVDPATGAVLAEVSRPQIPAERLTGNVALVSENGKPVEGPRQSRNREREQRGGSVRFWFRDWRVSGSKVEAHPGRAFGPILFAMHTLSKGVMKMTAQMPPLGVEDSSTVRLQIRRPGSSDWETIDEEHIHTLARTATFRIPGWDAARDVPYRLVYELVGPDGATEEHDWIGTVAQDPAAKDTIVVAAFTGNQDTGFPNTPTVRNLGHHDPDVMVFTGDQIYENVAGFGIERAPVETAALDYLRKWYLLGWSFGDLMRDRVTVCMPDDHDVYQGNIWGGGGRKISLEQHQRGGYAMPAEWVNMVQRTQTSHLPDPYDPRPLQQGIGVYFTELNYGRISFGIIEDRKFKSGPEGITPPTGGRPDHITDPNFNPETYDVPGTKLLGERQLAFIRDWTSNWRHSDMKVSLTQTIFANAATTHGSGFMRLVADLDSNGWPQSARNRALRELRKGFAFMIGGDQHLPSIIHHGVDDWNDAGYSFCVPSIAAGYPRLYEPEEPGRNRLPGMPEYTGEHFDGLRNRITVWAVANPKKQWRESPLERLHDKASGYGIIRLHKKTGRITIECWPLLIDASNAGADGQFAGWPKTIGLEDNYGREPAAYLPLLEVAGVTNPVVQVIDESNDEIVYTLRVRGSTWRPKVFKQGRYTVRVGEPDSNNIKTLRGLNAPAGEAEKVEVDFE